MDLLQVVPSTDKTRTANSVRAQKVAPANIAILPLSNAERDEVVDHAATKDPIARSAQASKAETRSHLRPHRGLRTNKVRNTSVVQEVQASNAGERLRDDVCQDAAPALCVHWLELRRDVPLECLAVPEEHPRADADVADGVVGDELDDLVELFLLRRVVGAVFPELVEPCELEASMVLVYGL
jgi:hypothetical protein